MDKTKKLFNTKLKKVIISLVVIVIIIAGSFGVYVLNQPAKKLLKLKQNEIIIEYGSQVSTDITNYLDTTNLSKEEVSKVKKKAKLDLSIKNEADKNYIMIGNYKEAIMIKYDEEIVKVNIIVKDTIAPVINGDAELKVEFVEGTSYDFNSLIKVEDKSATEVSFDVSGVNKDVVGNYIATVTAKDSWANVTTKNITVKVTAKPVEVIIEEETQTTNSNNNTNSNTNSNNTNNNNSNSNNNTNNNNSNGNNNNTNSNNNDSNSNNTNNNSNNVCKSELGNTGKLFNSEAEAIAFGEKYGGKYYNGKWVSRYGVSSAGCGKWNVQFWYD